MNRAQSFFFVCLGILALALAYHFGATTATAQAPVNPVVAVSGDYVYTANGDVYQNVGSWTFRWVGGVFGGGTPAQVQTWGSVKAKYATPAPGVRVTR